MPALPKIRSVRYVVKISSLTTFPLRLQFLKKKKRNMLLTFSCQTCTEYVAPHPARTALFCPMLGTALETSGDASNPVCCLKNIPVLRLAALVFCPPSV